MYAILSNRNRDSAPKRNIRKEHEHLIENIPQYYDVCNPDHDDDDSRLKSYED